MRASSLTMAVLAVGLLAGCSNGNNGDGGFMNLGGLMGGSSSRDNSRQMASDAVSACGTEVKSKGWTVERVGQTEASGVNNINVDMRIRQGDGDTHDVTCVYDEGKQRAEIEQ